MTWRITGRIVVEETGRPIAGLVVRATDLDLIFHDFLGETRTDEDGCFEIQYTEDDFSDYGIESNPDLVLDVHLPTNGREILNTREFPRNDASQHEHYDIKVSYWAFRREDGMRFWSHRPQVRGRVTTGETDQAIPGLHAELWNVDTETRVALDPTDESGTFALWYDDSNAMGPRKFRLKLRMPGGGGRVIYEGPVLEYNGVESLHHPVKLSYTLFHASDGPAFRKLLPESAPSDVVIELPTWQAEE